MQGFSVFSKEATVNMRKLFDSRSVLCSSGLVVKRDVRHSPGYRNMCPFRQITNNNLLEFSTA